MHSAEQEGDGDARAHALSVEVPKLISQLLMDDNGGWAPRYDAVLVDEAQDFLPAWWNALRLVCKPGGEMLLAADRTQDIYGTAQSWTEAAMTGCGFTGRWNEFKTSYRLPPSLIPHVRHFASEFISDKEVFLPNEAQLELSLYPSQLRWVQTSEPTLAEISAKEIFKLVQNAEPDLLAVPDICVIVDKREIGAEIVKLLEERKVSVAHTYDIDSREARQKKLYFFKGDARVKATTLHSFKGWEARAIVLVLSRSAAGRNAGAIYTGLTRLKRHEVGSYLTVVCSAAENEAYGRSWPVFHSTLEKEGEFTCERCGKSISRRGRCLRCNIILKGEAAGKRVSDKQADFLVRQFLKGKKGGSGAQ